MPRRKTSGARTLEEYKATTPEKDFQATVVNYARLKGWRVAHFHDSRREVKPGVLVGDTDAAGFPDLVMVRRGHIVFAELKSETGTVSVEQRAWLDDLCAAMDNCPTPEVHVRMWRPSDWKHIERDLR